MTSAWSVCLATTGRCPCVGILIRFDEDINRFDALKTGCYHTLPSSAAPHLASTLYVHARLVSIDDHR
jgi:hypothetical protein